MKQQVQTATDYQRHLQDAVNALSLSSAAYDRGFLGEAKRLAATIRVLLHDTTASKSLLKQMSLKDKIRYYTSPNPYGAGNLLTECHLVLMQIHFARGSITYVPLLDSFPPEFSWTELPFDDWWTQRVVRDKQLRELSRRDLILALANKDGGAHVDPNLDAVYADLSRRNSLSWEIVTGASTDSPADGPQFACVRQVAHELTKSIHQHLGVTAETDSP
jgi:hypothetical protein